MKKNIRSIGMLVLVVIWVAVTVFAWFGPQNDYSLWERRPLDKMPPLKTENLLNGSFMGEFEDYTLDQFPGRDSFRTLKSLFSYRVLQMKDNNGIYLADGSAGKIEYPLNKVSVSNALKKFNFIYEKCLKDTGSKIFMTVIPDKGYYLAEENGYPALDYQQMFKLVEEGMPWAEVVDITNALSASDYYRTDTHWRQEKIQGVAQILCDKLGVTMPTLTPKLATEKFYGVYYGQAALPMAADDLYIMEGNLLNDCKVFNFETQKYGSIYDAEKLNSADPYETYLSGAQALLVVENPNATTDRELIIFRDSFGSSLAPYLVQDYKTVTLVDIRYISSSFLKNFIKFNGQDVLFAYSTLVLNSSSTMK